MLWARGSLFHNKGSGMITALLFDRVNSTHESASLSFDDFLQAIETDTPQKKRCRELKAAYAEAILTGGAAKSSAAKDAYDAAKSKISPWIIGARLNGPRNNSNVIAEGYVTVDFDDVSDCEALKNTLSLCPHVLLAAQSLGGRGVFCIIPTTPEIQKSPEKIKILWQELSNYTEIPIGAKDTGGPHIDSACSDAARLRFESYDPWPVYNPDARVWKPFEDLAYESYLGSKIFEFAQCFGGAPDPGRENSNARNAFALAAISVIARARAYGESPFMRGLYFPFKAQTVVLGRTGSNKGVTLDALRAAAGEFGVTRLRSASDAMLIDAMAKSAATCETVGKGMGAETIWTPRPEPLAVLEVIDEAGDDKAARKNRDYTAQATDLRRQLFNELTELSAALSRPAPDFPVKAAYTNIQISTPERWAENVNAGDGAAGDARRVAEFWLPSPLDNVETTDPVIVGKLLHRVQFTPANVGRLTDLMSVVDARGAAHLPCNVCDWVLYGALPYLGGQDRETVELNITAYRTLSASFATACAYARGADRIEDEDFLAGASLFIGVLETRRRLAPLACKVVGTQQSAITDMIIKTLRVAGDKGVRLDKLTGAGGKCASPDHAKVLASLIAEGVVVKYKGMTGGKVRTLIRIATEEELAQRETQDFSEERANRDKVDRGDADFGPYATCSPDEKRARVRGYIDKYKTDHPLYPGARNHGLWELRVLLQRRNDMWDSAAQEEFRETALATGLPENEIKLLMRANIDGRNPLDKPS